LLDLISSNVITYPFLGALGTFDEFQKLHILLFERIFAKYVLSCSLTQDMKPVLAIFHNSALQGSNLILVLLLINLG